MKKNEYPSVNEAVDMLMFIIASMQQCLEELKKENARLQAIVNNRDNS